MQAWFNILGVPILGFGGYASQTYMDEIRRDALWEFKETRRPPVLLYAGDFDASGEDMVRDIDVRTHNVFGRRIVRVALTEDQVDDLDLPVDVGKEEDPRAEDFRTRHGGLWQVELDALFGIAPGTLRDMFVASLESYWDPDAYFDVLSEEDIGRAELVEQTS